MSRQQRERQKPSGAMLSPKMDETSRAPCTTEDADVTCYSRLIETELVRERLFTSILNRINKWLTPYQAKHQWSEMQIAHLLLRYIFNKNATRPRSVPDPVFIIGDCQMARRQLDRDLRSVRLTNGAELADLIDDELDRAAFKMSETETEVDGPVTISADLNGKLIYRGRVQDDFSRLAQRYGPDYYQAAYALGVRYSYLRLAAHGLARAYKDETKLAADNQRVCECFASAFNHYFDSYFSAFPDLERFFGSRGSFFQADWRRELQGMTYYINPPFDSALIELAVDHVLNVLENSLVSEARFIFTVPGTWTDFNALVKLKKNRWVVKIVDYPKGKLPFIDYMAKEGSRIIYPTDICEIIMENKHEEEFYD